jgi:hypothetical protein
MHEAAMSFYRDQVYPHLVSWLGNPKPIEEIRQRLVPLAKGNVLEIGAGPGVNFAHYDPATVNKGCFDVPRSKDGESNWKLSFWTCQEKGFLWLTRVSIRQ